MPHAQHLKPCKYIKVEEKKGLGDSAFQELIEHFVLLFSNYVRFQTLMWVFKFKEALSYLSIGCKMPYRLYFFAGSLV